MTFYLLIPLVVLLSFKNPTKVELVGKWAYEGAVNKNNKTDCCTECPDLIEFRSNNSYIVMNDCYGADPMKPIVETGKWEVAESSKKVILKERKFTTNHYLYSPKKQIELAIISFDGKKLKVRYAQGKIEQYTREK
ncbi:hypothetical protein [Rufibacter ruber]|uniref:hypothetical protein n=1 Tax=Rufibacter ruber TaxID=1783499 RepID=UPI000830661C|nr:hypothetical protein [Rufibacter ruber]